MRIKLQRHSSSGYALLTVLGITGVTLIVLAATMSRTTTVANLNERNNQYIINVNAAEAAVEKAFALMAYDFQDKGLGQVQNHLSIYRGSVPTNSESSYWNNFVFSNARGSSGSNQTYVELYTNNYTGLLPSQYPGLMATKSPIYRIISNVRAKTGYTTIQTAVQEDVMLALVPITTYAIFYNGLLEFSTCATMTVNGRVHCNTNIYVGAGSSALLTFNGAVTSSGTVTATTNNSSGWVGPTTYNSNNWRTVFPPSPNSFAQHAASVTLSLTMTNTRSLIEQPTPGVAPTNITDQARAYYQANMILLVSNSTVTLQLQKSPSSTQIPYDDSSKYVTNYTYAQASNSLPWLTLTNRFVDQREDKTNIVTQIDIKKYIPWALTNSIVQNKFDKAADQYPTILYVADNRITNSGTLPSVRLANAQAIPTNGTSGAGLGFTVATPNPLYVWGNYNASVLASTNTSSARPAALMCDALTILSTNWTDKMSYVLSQDGSNAAPSTTINAAILTGVVASTTNTSAGFSGGVHNLPRLLENWSSKELWLNTSIVCLFNSAKGTNKFVTPGTGSYYNPPTRKFSFDPNLLDPARQPPGVPCALVPIRYNWAVPPINTTNYNVAL